MFTFIDADIVHAALVSKIVPVIPFKKPASPRCLFEIPDTPEVRSIISDFEQRKIIPIPHKDFINEYRRLLSVCKTLQAGRIGGGV